MRGISYSLGLLLFAAATGLTIFAIASPYWTKSTNNNTIGRVANVTYGLWGARFCVLGQCEFRTLQELEDACIGECSDDFKDLLLASRVAAGLLISATVFFATTALFALAKLVNRCCSSSYKVNYFLGVFGALLASIGWGLYYHFFPDSRLYKSDWNYCLWIALAGWLSAVLGWIIMGIYKLHQKGDSSFILGTLIWTCSVL